MATGIDRAAAEEVARNAMAALQRGDGTLAKEQFARLVEGGHATAAMRMMLARACQMSGDPKGAAQALDTVLAAEPGNVRALLMRGDAFRIAGDLRAAASFFQAALKAAAAMAAVPPDLAAGLQQAQAFVADSADRFTSAVREAVAGMDGPESWRIRHAMEMLTGEREVHYQQPSVLYFPYLPQRQFYEREEFGWTAGLEAETPAIQAELAALLDEGARFDPYVQPEENRPHRDFHGMHGDPSWTAFYLWKDGALVDDNAARCPRTAAALESLPLSRVGSRTPSVLFSLLRPGAHIPPHFGMLNCRLICHLPLIVPPGCWLRVGNEKREWQEGKLLIFDDSMEHEAKNCSDSLRVVLLFDVWRPELSEAEQRGVSAIFEAIDRLGGVPEED